MCHVGKQKSLKTQVNLGNSYGKVNTLELDLAPTFTFFQRCHALWQVEF